MADHAPHGNAALYRSDKEESLRKCSLCEESKPVSQFSKAELKRSDAGPRCLVCDKEEKDQGMVAARITEEDD